MCDHKVEVNCVPLSEVICSGGWKRDTQWYSKAEQSFASVERLNVSAQVGWLSVTQTRQIQEKDSFLAGEEGVLLQQLCLDGHVLV